MGEHLPRLNVKFCMGVGGSLDVLSGEVARAPEAFRKVGMEWLYRALSQPRRIPRVLANGFFMLDVMKAALFNTAKT